jgi:apolipoprotein N-acyltransferase
LERREKCAFIADRKDSQVARQSFGNRRAAARAGPEATLYFGREEAMHLAVSLFLLNFLDAGLTLFWIRNGLAEEANRIMQFFLDGGEGPFIVFKISMGLFAALCFQKWKHLRAAQLGVRLALGVYVVITAIHLMVGLTAAGVLHRLGI